MKTVIFTVIFTKNGPFRLKMAQKFICTIIVHIIFLGVIIINTNLHNKVVHQQKSWIKIILIKNTMSQILELYIVYMWDDISDLQW